MSTPQRPGAMDGVRVLDFTTMMSGPYATRLLADLGAEVIKIESPTGDHIRSRPPRRQGRSTYFAQLNCGKKSLALDLKKPQAIALIKQLVSTADVVVAGWRPHKTAAPDGSPLLGSLLLGAYDAQGRLHHLGVSSSFTAFTCLRKRPSVSAQWATV